MKSGYKILLFTVGFCSVAKQLSCNSAQVNFKWSQFAWKNVLGINTTTSNFSVNSGHLHKQENLDAWLNSDLNSRLVMAHVINYKLQHDKNKV